MTDGQVDIIRVAEKFAPAVVYNRLLDLEDALDRNLAAGVQEQKLRDALHERIAVLTDALRPFVYGMKSNAGNGFTEVTVRESALVAARAALGQP